MWISLCRRASLCALAALAGGWLVLAPPALRAQSIDAGAYLAARQAVMEHRYAQSLRWFERALETTPQDPALLSGLLLSQAASGAFDEAGDTARALLSLGEARPLAEIALVIGGGAQGRFDQLAALPPQELLGPPFDDFLRAWIKLGAGQTQAALADFDRLSTQPVLAHLARYHKALALGLSSDWAGTEALLSELDPQWLGQHPRGALALVSAMSQQGRFEEASALLEPLFGPEQEQAAQALRRRLDAHEPLPFESAIRAPREGMAEVFLLAARNMAQYEQELLALIYARAAIYLSPLSGDALLFGGALMQSLGQVEVAYGLYARLSPETLGYFEAQQAMADAAYALGRKDEARALLHALTSSHPHLRASHIAYGDLLRKEEDFTEAAAAYSRAIEATPNPQKEDWTLFFLRAVTLERSDDWEGAKDDLRRALALDPNQPRALNYLGYGAVENGEDLEQALAIIQRAVTLAPEAGFIVDSLGWAYYRLGRYEEALAPMERANALEPADPVITDHLGDVYWALGQSHAARLQWRRALSFAPEEEEAARIRRKLNQEEGEAKPSAAMRPPPRRPSAPKGAGD